MLLHIPTASGPKCDVARPSDASTPPCESAENARAAGGGAFVAFGSDPPPPHHQHSRTHTFTDPPHPRRVWVGVLLQPCVAGAGLCCVWETSSHTHTSTQLVMTIAPSTHLITPRHHHHGRECPAHPPHLHCGTGDVVGTISQPPPRSSKDGFTPPSTSHLLREETHQPTPSLDMAGSACQRLCVCGCCSHVLTVQAVRTHTRIA